jgi:hypothetical protein
MRCMILGSGQASPSPASFPLHLMCRHCTAPAEKGQAEMQSKHIAEAHAEPGAVQSKRPLPAPP